jgi:hypothetical protein
MGKQLISCSRTQHNLWTEMGSLRRTPRGVSKPKQEIGKE